MCVYRSIGEVRVLFQPSTSTSLSMQVIEKSSFVGSPAIPHLGRWVGNSGAETLVVATPTTPARYVSLSLEVVGTVSYRDFNMQAHGNWASTLPHNLCDHAGTFLLEGHGSQIIALTWTSVLRNMKRLQGDSLDGTVTGQDAIMFTHRLFRVRASPHIMISLRLNTLS